MKANAKSATAVRCKKKWTNDCLLLKIKSTAIYTFLHKNEFLPLPNPRTFYGYLINLKAEFGFDSTLFTVLCEQLETVPERERRWVLIYDEMSVRKSVQIREPDMAMLGNVVSPNTHDQVMMVKTATTCWSFCFGLIWEGDHKLWAHFVLLVLPQD
ncbi:hypothetical protein MRX96_020428 [Rhipicephalus microplus]